MSDTRSPKSSPVARATVGAGLRDAFLTDTWRRERQKDVRPLATFRDEYGAKPRGTFLSDGVAFDGVPKLINYERLEDYPVTVLVTRGMPELMQTYNFRLTVVLIVSSVLTLIVLAFTLILHRSLGALHKARDELRRIAPPGVSR